MDSGYKIMIRWKLNPSKEYISPKEEEVGGQDVKFKF